MCEESRKKTFLGFDFSTQKLKALIIGEQYEVLHEAEVEFDVDLPEFRTSGGVCRSLEVAGEVTAPPLLWVKALELAMDRLVLAGADLSAVHALSGAAQQHGSVWWSKEAEAKLSSLCPEQFLHTQLEGAIVALVLLAPETIMTQYRIIATPEYQPSGERKIVVLLVRIALVSSPSTSSGRRTKFRAELCLLHLRILWVQHHDDNRVVTNHVCLDRHSAFTTASPVWMDSSTGADCRALEEMVGGAEELSRVTGSRAYERFTGPQVRKMLRCRPRVYHATARISLVSSFAASLFLGRIAPIDLADGSGMNLLDIHSQTWWDKALEVCGDDSLPSKLGTPVPSGSALGPVSPYHQRRYGLREDCQVIAFTGDNCSALAGLRLRPGWLGLSLGTSDTLLLPLREPIAPLQGHLLLSPTPSAGPYMALLCFANGSLTRQNHRDRLAGKSWDAFNELLSTTVRGNLGYMGIYYDTAEILPRRPPGRWLWSPTDLPLQSLEGRGEGGAALEGRALLEGQALARRDHAEKFGLTIDASSRIVATGGASANKELLQIFADVFNAPVYVQDSHANAALLGAAIRAADVWSQHHDVTLPGSEPALSPVARPFADAERIYSPLLQRYRTLVDTITPPAP